MAEICHLENRHNANVIFYAESGTIWIKFCRLVQNDMSTASDSLAIIALYKLVLCYVCYVIWSKSKPDVELQYGGRFGEFHGMSSQSHCRVLPPGEFNGMSSQSHVSHCRVLPLGEFIVMIPEPHAILQGAVIWRNQCHDRATLQDVIIPFAIFKTVFAIFFCFFDAVWVLTCGGFRIMLVS